MKRDALDALFYLMTAAGIIAGAISLAVSAEREAAEKRPAAAAVEGE